MMIRAKPEVKYKLIQEMTSRDNNLLNITWLCESWRITIRLLSLAECGACSICSGISGSKSV